MPLYTPARRTESLHGAETDTIVCSMRSFMRWCGFCASVMGCAIVDVYRKEDAVDRLHVFFGETLFALESGTRLKWPRGCSGEAFSLTGQYWVADRQL
jgi:hypothetical protein